MRAKLLAFAVIAAIALIVGAVPSSAIGVGDKAPAFKLDSVVGDSTIKQPQTTGKATIVAFWMSRCPHCQREVPILQRLYTSLKGRGLNVIGISGDENKQAAASFVKDYSLTFPNAFAGTKEGDRVIDAYNIRGVPALFLIDDSGRIKSSYIGETSEKTLRQDLAGLGVK